MPRFDKETIHFALFEIVVTFLLILLMAHFLPAAQQAKAHYRHDGPAVLPDAKYSPGEIAIADRSQLCPVAHTAARRHVTREMKMRVCEAYGIPAAKCNGRNYEIDHIISLELGGSNSLTNLFPQPWWPRPGAHEKDHLENWLHAQVCSGKITLGAAQRFIARDWYRLYLKMKQEGAK